MTTPLNPLDREAWSETIYGAMHEYPEDGLDSRRVAEIIDKILTLQTQLTEALAEVERLMGIVGKVHSMAVQANVRGEYVPTGFILEAIEKARQPDV